MIIVIIVIMIMIITTLFIVDYIFDYKPIFNMAQDGLLMLMKAGHFIAIYLTAALNLQHVSP